MTERKTWEEFRASKLLWWVNRSLHLFGWSIVYDFDDNLNVTDVYPARVKFRGFTEDIEEEGFKGMSTYLVDNIKELEEEAHE